MVLLKIRRAWCALDDGRLDEAYELARTEPVREHRQGQDLANRLVQRLMERGREHLTAGRAREALADAAKAQELAGNTPQVIDLRNEAIESIDADDRARRRKQRVLLNAQRHLATGQLAAAARTIDGCTTVEGISEVRHQLEDQRGSVELAMGRAKAALEMDDPVAAIDHLLAGRGAGADASDCDQVAAEVTQRVTDDVLAALNAGNLDRAGWLLERLRIIAPRGTRAHELERILNRCLTAHRLLRRRRFRRLATALRQLQPELPDAAWIVEAEQAAREASRQVELLSAGPLGAVTPAAMAFTQMEGNNPGVEPRRPSPTVAAIVRSERLLKLLLMQIDGVGSFLVATGEKVTLGPISSSRRPDIPLIAEAGMPPMVIRRADDDYFVESPRRALLSHGQKLELSPRCRLRFLRPNPASTSAVLELSGARLAGCDARRVILLDRELIIGPTPVAHISAPALSEPIVLQHRDGRLVYMGRGGCTIAGQPCSIPADVPVGLHVQIGPLSLVVTEAPRQ